MCRCYSRVASAAQNAPPHTCSPPSVALDNIDRWLLRTDHSSHSLAPLTCPDTQRLVHSPSPTTEHRTQSSQQAGSKHLGPFCSILHLRPPSQTPSLSIHHGTSELPLLQLSRCSSPATEVPPANVELLQTSIGTGYDLSNSVFSPDGRNFQVEYAAKAVENGGTVIGIRCTDGVVLAVEKLITSKLVVASSNKRIATVDTHIGIVGTPLPKRT